MAINTQKLVPSSFGSQQVSQKKLIEVKRSVIDVEKLMTGIVAFEKKQQDAQRKSTEEKRYQKRENDLERKTIKKQFKMNLPSLPRMGFFDWIKNFVTNTLLGFFAVRLLKYVPQLVGVAGLALNAAEGIFNFAGGLLNGAATFIEWGYKAYDATRGFLRQIGGENTAQLFDKFLNGLDTFLLLTLGASTFKIGREIIGNVLRSLGTTLGGGLLGRFGGRLLGRRGPGGSGINRIVSGRQARQAQQARRKRFVARRFLAAANEQIAINAYKGYRAAGLPQEAAYRKATSGSMFSGISREKVIGGAGEIPTTSGGSATATKSRGPRYTLGGSDPSSFDAQEAIRKQLGLEPKLGDPGQPTREQAKILQRMTRKDVSERGMRDLQERLTRLGFEERAAKDAAAFRRMGMDVDPKALASAQADAGLARLMGGDVPRMPMGRMSPTKMVLSQARGIFRKFRLPIIGAVLDFAISVALGESPGRAAFKAIGAGLLSGVLGAVGSVVPVAGNLIGGLVGGIIGDQIGGALYDIFFGNKKPQTPKQNPQGFASGGEVGRGPRKRVKKIRREYLSQPAQDAIEPGKDVGKKKFEEMFPKGSSGGLFGVGSKKDAYGYLESGFGVLSGTSFFGPLFGIAIKSLSGDKPTSSDYRAASFGLSNWMTSTFGNVAMQGFANGGLVGGGLFLDSRQIQRTIESSLEDRITSEVDDAINELRRRLGIEGKEGKKGGGGSTTSPEGYNEKPSSSTSGTGGEMVRSAEGTKLAAELGRFIESKLSSPEDYNRITEHPEFGGSFKRNYNSWHNVDRAIDIGAYSYEQQKILDVIEEFNKQRGVQPVELLHAGNDPTGLHDDHVHVAYFGGGLTGKGGLIRTHPGEYVIDKDSVDLYSIPFFNIINQTENESQRKQNSLRLMSILQSYAGYESGFEQTVTVPVPTPQMIPIPVPMQSNEPIMMSGGGGSSGRASDILESIG